MIHEGVLRQVYVPLPFKNTDNSKVLAHIWRVNISQRCCCVGKVTKPTCSVENSEPSAMIRAHTSHGNLSVVVQDWVSSLKLGQFMEDEEEEENL